MMKTTFSVLFLICLLIFFSCKKEDHILNSSSNLSLSFSKDTLLFDTVFTTVGSATRSFKVYNNSNEDIILNSISLARTESPFRINVDGESGNTVNDIFIRANDSIYIFSEVTIDPNQAINELGQSLHLIEQDSIIFNYNNQIQDIDLVAWGIDANFYCGFPDYEKYQSEFLDSIYNEEYDDYYYYYNIKTDTYWNNDKPHVIYGDIWVTNGAKLTINEGANLYLHNNATLIIGDPRNDNITLGPGTLEINGTKDNLVTIQGDRLEEYYQQISGQWDRIWLTSRSLDNVVEYAFIKNGTIGLHIDSVTNQNPSLHIKNSIINNMSGLGILGQGAHIEGENLLISNAGQYALALNIGGEYDFKHCTFANYYNLTSRQTPSIFINNYYEDINGQIQYRELLKANFGNCIIYGDNENEILFDALDGSSLNYLFDHCLVKMDLSVYDPENDNLFQNTMINEDPLFLDKSIWDFRLDSLSPALNYGKDEIANLVPYDLDGNYRLNNPDLGCFERVD
tara:strand:+ start:586 stop:2118 length:1533 start_codon:yes stop_codon:yes gene_type:complete